MPSFSQGAHTASKTRPFGTRKPCVYATQTARLRPANRPFAISDPAGLHLEAQLLCARTNIVSYTNTKPRISVNDVKFNGNG